MDIPLYNSRGKQLPEGNLPAADTLEEDRIIIKGKCVFYRVYFKDNFSYASVMPTKEVYDSYGAVRVVNFYEERWKPTFYNYKGEQIPEPTACTRLKEIDIPWFEKEYDKHGRCMGFRIYSINGRQDVCQFNDYILEKEAGQRYKKETRIQKKKEKLAAAIPFGVRDQNGALHWVDRETGELKD